MLEQVRSAIKAGMPDAAESISYDITTYKLDGRAAIYLGGWKKHYSFYPAGPEPVTAFGAELAPYKVEKGTIRFPLGEPVPLALIAAIARFRAQGRGA